MSMYALLALTLSAAPVLAADAVCLEQRNDQQRAWDARREGRILPLPEIERRVLPQMSGLKYLGPELDADSNIYTLKFLRNDNAVIWVRVDGRTGQIISRTS